MCQASLEGYRARDAVEGETVHAVRNHGGAFSSDPNRTSTGDLYRTNNMVCVKYGQKCTLENLQFHQTMQGSILEKAGTRQVVTLVTPRMRGYGDYFLFEDGTKVLSAYVWSPIYIGVKPEVHDKGMKAVDAAIDEGLKTTVEEPKGVIGRMRDKLFS